MQTTPDTYPPPEPLELAEADSSVAPLLFNDVSTEVQQQIDLIDAIFQTPDKKARREAILHAAETLGKPTRTIRSMMD